MISMNDVILILSHKMDKWNFDYGQEKTVGNILEMSNNLAMFS